MQDVRERNIDKFRTSSLNSCRNRIATSVEADSGLWQISGQNLECGFWIHVEFWIVLSYSSGRIRDGVEKKCFPMSLNILRKSKFKRGNALL